MKSAVVTGAGGFLGKNLTERLRTEGVSVLALMRADYDFGKASGQEIGAQEPDVFYHMAWDGLKAGVRDDFSVQMRNVEYTLNAVELAARIGAKRFIYPGSASEFAMCGRSVNGENAPVPSDAYGAAKASARLAAAVRAKKLGLEFVSAIISSVYGPGRDDGNILSYAIKTLLKGEKPSFTGLEQLWDFIYIDDLMSALISIGERGADGAVYAVGGGTARPMRGYIEELRDVINPALPLGIGNLPYKMGVPDGAVFDISRLCEDCGFVPRTAFTEGIRRTIEYFSAEEEICSRQ